jgi:hypothetical protein
LSDPRLLGKALAGDSWHTWRTMLEPLTGAELATFQAVTGRQEAPKERCEELIGIVGRRGGKSRAVAVKAREFCTGENPARLKGHLDHLLPARSKVQKVQPSEVVEAALAHVIWNKVEAAYQRGDLFEKRRVLMKEWADYCSMPNAAAPSSGD